MGDLSSIPGLGRWPGEGNDNLLPAFLPGEFRGQRSLGTVHRVANSQTWLSDFHTHTLRELRSYMLQGQKKNQCHIFLETGQVTSSVLIWFGIFISMLISHHFFFLLAVQHGLWDLSPPTRDQTCALSKKSTESWLLDCLEIPFSHFFNI